VADPCAAGRLPLADLDVLADEPEEDPVHPGAVTPVRSTAHAFPPEARSLEMAEGGLVEAVDLDLNSVVVEVEDEMTNEQPGRGGRKPSAAVGWLEHDRVEVGDAAPAVGDVECHRACGLPTDLDHESSVKLGLLVGAPELLLQLLALARRETAAMNGSTSS
jgi:hypothetical protein